MVSFKTGNFLYVAKEDKKVKRSKNCCKGEKFDEIENYRRVRNLAGMKGLKRGKVKNLVSLLGRGKILELRASLTRRPLPPRFSTG